MDGSRAPVDALWIVVERLSQPEREALAAYSKSCASVVSVCRQFEALPSKMLATSGILAALTIEGSRLWERFANDREAPIHIERLRGFVAACDENANNCLRVLSLVAAATPDGKRSSHEEASEFLCNVADAIRWAITRVLGLSALGPADEPVVRDALHNAILNLDLKIDIESVLKGILKEAIRVEDKVADPEPEPTGLEHLRMAIFGVSDPASLRTLEQTSRAATYLQPMADAAKLFMAESPEKKEGTDLTAFRPAKEFLGTNGMKTHTKLSRFLGKHPNIRTMKPSGSRLLVHAGDWAAHWAAVGDIRFEAMDTGAIVEAAHEQASIQARIREDKQRAGERPRKI